jgi:hypothetical protein
MGLKFGPFEGLLATRLSKQPAQLCAGVTCRMCIESERGSVETPQKFSPLRLFQLLWIGCNAAKQLEGKD